MSIGHDLEEGIEMIKKSRPCICINPGFLCQLYLLAKKGSSCAELKLFMKYGRQTPVYSVGDIECEIERCNDPPSLLDEAENGSNIIFPPPLSPSTKSILNTAATLSQHPTCHKRKGEDVDNFGISASCIRVVACKACKQPLAGDNDIVQQLDCNSFLKKHVEPFWKGYRPMYSISIGASSVVTPQLMKGHYIIGPVEWATSQIESSPTIAMGSSTTAAFSGPVGKSSCCSGASIDATIASFSSAAIRRDLLCPGCGVVCGYYKSHALALCGAFVRTNLFALECNVTCLRRLVQAPHL
jgi:hypothetical protein